MAFYEKPWAERKKKGGDPAENQFRAFARRNNFYAEHYGFDRSKLAGFWKLPAFVKTTPDFACVGREGFLVECKGVGYDGMVKLKQSDLEALKTWNTLAPTYLFVYDSSQGQVSFTKMERIFLIVQNAGLKTGRYPDNNKLFYLLPRELLTWEDTPYGET